MHILAASYANIGPFSHDHIITVDFRAGSHLIQAPIGSGKSFLFFDGPLFGLYKYRTRPILNKNSKNATVQVLLHHDEQHRLIERTITPTRKGGESVKTKLYQVNLTGTQKDIFLPDKGGADEGVGRCAPSNEDSLLTLSSSHILDSIPTSHLTHVEFTSGAEADKAIEALLPPREVILSTNFLMQQSESVFELPPAQRVQVFKHLFGLLGIDDAKDKITDMRRQLQTTIQVKKDTTTHDTKLKHLIQTIATTTQRIKESSPPTPSIRENNEENQSSIQASLTTLLSHSFFQDLTLIHDRIQGGGFSLDTEILPQIEQVLTDIDLYTQTLHQQEGKILEQQKQKQEIETQLTQAKNHYQALVTEQKKLQSSIQTQDTHKHDEFNQKKQHIQKELDAIDQKIPYEDFAQYGYPLSSYTQLQSTLQTLIHTGKDYKQQHDILTTRILQQQEQQKLLTSQLDNIIQQRTQLTQDYETQNRFQCDKIDAPCPYIDVINKNASGALQKQMDTLTTQEKKVKEQLTAHTPDILKQLTDQRTQNEHKTKELKNFLTKINRQQLQAYTQDVHNKTQEIRTLQQHIDQHTQKQKELQQHKEKLISISTQITSIQTQIETLTQDLHSKQQDTQSNTIQTITEHKHIYSTLKQYITTLVSDMTTLQSLLQDYTSNQLEIKKLNEKLSRIKDLHHIFSKELMIVVLQDFLPTLEEVLNSYLGQIVEYQIRFVTPTEAGEQLELDILIVDPKGERPVKSLSGGQKTVLKLSWMLAVATLFKSSFLLLDETINNLDAHTISQVADVLEEFVSKQNLHFYVVTHSPQIQQMDIWDSVVRVEKAII